MSKIKLTGSNSGYVEISSAADAGNLTLALPTSGTELLSNGNNVYTGITTFSNDVKFEGASYNVVWDKSDSQLEFANNAKLSFGDSADLQIYHNTETWIKNNTSTLNILNDGTTQIKNNADNQFVATFVTGGTTGLSGCHLYFNNSEKFYTTDTGTVTNGICTATSFSGSGEGLTYTSPLSHRNIIINGDMRVAQRGTSANMSSSGNDFPACDRWSYNRNGPSATVAQVAEAPDGSGFKYSLKWTNTSPVGSISAGNALIFLYKIEGQDIRRLGYGHSSGKIATLSFYAKGSLAGKVGVACRRDGRIFSANSDMTANTWQRHSIVIPVDASTGFSANDNDNGWQFGICWGGGSNSTSGTTNGNWINFHNAYTAGFTANQQGAYLTTNGSTFQITGVQLEIGSQATPFEHRSIGEEIQRCKRYYQRFTAYGDHHHFGVARAESNTARTGIVIPVPMRAMPTVACNGHRTFTGDAGYNTESTSTPALAYSGAGWVSDSNIYTIDFPGHSLNHNRMYCLMSKTTSTNALTLDSEL